MFHYYKTPGEVDHLSPAPRVARVREGMTAARSLLAAVGRALAFPRYYGRNFDAFWDCVRDLDIEEHDIVLLHEDLPDIPRDDLATYLELLRDAVLYWKKRPDEHSFAVWFPMAAREKVVSVLSEAPPPDTENLD